jgi:hypothetical protein
MIKICRSYARYSLISLILLLFACNVGRIDPPDGIRTSTAYPTITRTTTATRPGMMVISSPTDLERRATWGSYPPSATSMPGQTLTPTPPDWGTVPAICNWAQFINHTTYPDGSIVVGQAEVTKTWRIKNIGSCTWSSLYSLVYQGLLWGYDPFVVPTRVYLNRTVRPGETVDLSVDLTTARVAGDYTAYWVLRSENGELFGLGPKANQALWMKVYIVGLTLTPTNTPTLTPTITMTPTSTVTPTSTISADRK